jgi:hypothetical protein
LVIQFLRTVGRDYLKAVFVPADFLEIGSREAVDVTPHRLVRQGTIRRLARGIHDFPEAHSVLGPLEPSTEAIARALAGHDRTRLQPAGAHAANALGHSEQVPAKVVFLTDGPARTIRIGSTTIQLRRTTPQNMASAGRLSGLLIQAFRELGQFHRPSVVPFHAAAPATDRLLANGRSETAFVCDRRGLP